jgi:hypothetical protein
MSRLVEDSELQKALDWLRDNAREIGEAKAEAIRTERMVRHIKALQMKLHSELPVSAQEREACASEAYHAAILAEAKAAGDYEVLRALREAAALKIESWRTEQANYRAMKI